MGNFTFSLLRFLALHFLLNSIHKSSTFQIETPAESNHYHIVEVSSLMTASTCNPSPTVSSQEGFLKLVQNYGPCSPSKHGKNRIGVRKDTDNIEYVVNVGLGTPKRELTLVMDTGSSLLWTQCKPCKLGRLSGGCYKQRHPVFDPSKSSTYTNVTCPSHTCSVANTTLGFSTCVSSACEYITAYLDGSKNAGFVAKERLSIGSNTVNDFIVGCSQVHNNISVLEGIDGILGLGQDFLSFVEQTAKTYQRVFSYCLPSKPSEIGFLKFGKAKPVSKSLKFTHLGAGYVLNLVGIKLGSTKLPITFKKGTASIDSGADITRLPPKDYITLREAYRKAMSRYRLVKLTDVLETCHHIGDRHKFKIPKISFLFADGLVLDLPRSGIAFPINSTLVCLPFTTLPGGENSVLFGNTQQQTLEIVYDVGGGKIGFGYGSCK